MYRVIDAVSIDTPSTNKYHACSKMRKEGRMASISMTGEAKEVRLDQGVISYRGLSAFVPEYRPEHPAKLIAARQLHSRRRFAAGMSSGV
jgi:hypothetical protein